MRSERDIKRAPKRPRAGAPTPLAAPGAPPGAPPAEAPDTPKHPEVTVSYAPRSDRPPRPSWDDRRPAPGPEAGRNDFRRDAPPRNDRDRPMDRGRPPHADPRARPPGPTDRDRPRWPEERRDAGPSRARDEPRGPMAGPRDSRGPAGHHGADRPNRPPGRPPERYASSGPSTRPPARSESPSQRPPQRSSERPSERSWGSAGPAGPQRPPRPSPADPGAFRPERGAPTTSGPQRVRRTEPLPGSIAAEQGYRLSKVLTDRGTASRREADDWIAAGWVKVDGQMAVLGQRVRPDARIEIDPAARTQQARQVTILLNKPIGYVSGQAEDGHEPASVLVTAANRWEEDGNRLPFHPGHARGLAPAGRLDIDSTGLLVLTQNGRIAKLLIGEDSDIEKEYLVRVENTRPGPFPEEDMKRLNHGLMLDDKVLKPAKVSWANEDQLRFVLREGRKRQIRRMCELVGLKVLALKRVRIGSVVLGKLPPGQWRFLRDDERF